MKRILLRGALEQDIRNAASPEALARFDPRVLDHFCPRDGGRLTRLETELTPCWECEKCHQIYLPVPELQCANPPAEPPKTYVADPEKATRPLPAAQPQPVPPAAPEKPKALGTPAASKKGGRAR